MTILKINDERKKKHLKNVNVMQIKRLQES